MGKYGKSRGCTMCWRYLCAALIALLACSSLATAGRGLESDYPEMPLSKVKQDANGDGTADFLGDTVTVRGVANISSGLLHESYLQIYIQNRETGLSLFSESIQSPVMPGDSLIATGVIQEYNGLIEVNVFSYENIGPASRKAAPMPLHKALDNPALYEGMLVKGSGEIIEKGNRDNGKYLKLSPSSDSEKTVMIYVTNFHAHFSEFDFESLSKGDHLNIAGILSIYSPKPEKVSADSYKIHLRTPDDLELAGISRYQMTLWGSLAIGLLLVIVAWITSLRRTVRKKTGQLQKSLAEKETLLKEIHHRVKNNLAIMSGLFELQLDTTDNDQARKVLRDSQSRLQSVALVHDKLYKTSSLTDIEMDQYIRELVQSLYETFGARQKSINIEFDIDDIYLDIDRALPCGLLINEITINAFKHAFQDGVEGDINISMKKNNGRARLTISDNGRGLDKDFESGKSNSLGLMLIDTLKDQLEARMEVESAPGNGTRYSFTFPVDS